MSNARDLRKRERDTRSKSVVSESEDETHESQPLIPQSGGREIDMGGAGGAAEARKRLRWEAKHSGADGAKGRSLPQNTGGSLARQDIFSL